MSQANIDLVRRIYEEFNDTLELPRWALHDNVEWKPPADEPDNAFRFGADAVVSYVRDWASTFDSYHCEVEELIECGDSIVAPLHLQGRIGTTGQLLSIPLTQVWTVRDGLIATVCEYRTRDEALLRTSASR